MKNTFRIYFSLITMLCSTTIFAQKYTSPPAKAEGKCGNASVVIEYCQPSAHGRKMLGDKEPFGKVWRTGANKSTSVTFSAPVKIEGKDLAAGTYALFTIPGENEWTIIINKSIEWGAFSYKEADDVLRVKVKPTKTDSFVETFNIAIENDQVILKWENTQVAFKVKG